MSEVRDCDRECECEWEGGGGCWFTGSSGEGNAGGWPWITAFWFDGRMFNDGDAGAG